MMMIMLFESEEGIEVRKRIRFGSGWNCGKTLKFGVRSF